MDAYSDYGERQFFDALEEISEISDSNLSYSENYGSCFSSRECDMPSSSTQFDVWIQNPESVESRRSKFFTWLGFGANEIASNSFNNSCDFDVDVARIASEDSEFSDSNLNCSENYGRSCLLCLLGEDSEFSDDLRPKENLMCTNKSSNEEIENRESGFDIVEHRDCSSSSTSTSGSSSSSSGGEFSPVKNSGVSFSVGSTRGAKKWWMNRLRSFNCVVERGEEPCTCGSLVGTRIQRVKVHQLKKQSKQLSALYHGQSIQAHKGAILTMKFSPDGKFLASAGEDRIVRVWQVIEDDKWNEHDIPDMDPSCAYFRMNHLSELKPLSMDKEKIGKLRRTSNSACVILPPKVFRILDKPLHEFHGHTSEILDLSWSNNNCLLSSSVDKTVRLWKIGFSHCLKVFPHNNYVTCVQFNPIDDNYFISGSIDGKVRIWEISCCKVVNWTEIKDIVTAVCYHPDGQGGIIGTMMGSCRFYNISDNQLQLDAQILLNNKKKSSGKRVTGFQFLPQDPSKVMVSCADSQVRIIQGVNVIAKYKCHRSAGSYCPAFSTSDGSHIISASEDANVCVWNCSNEDSGNVSQIRKIKSCERFLSNASVALPWPGLPHTNRANMWENGAFSGSTQGVHSFFPPAHVSCDRDFFVDSCCPKGSALWPEEKLVASRTSSIHKTSVNRSEYKFLKACQSRLDSNAWGLVIVTAGWDGKIKSFLNYGLPVHH